jgi:hypothetical protein
MQPQQQQQPEQHRRTAARCDLTLKFDRLPDDARTTDGRTSRCTWTRPPSR